jgi:histidine triad (HIT) family protein
MGIRLAFVSWEAERPLMSDDFYCEQVLSGETPVEVVLETDDVLAFHHTRPFWPVHIVVIPKAHAPSLTDLGDCDPSLLIELMAVVRHVAAEVNLEHGGARVLTNLGKYQDSKHLHFHVNSGEPRTPDPDAQ